MIVCGFECFLGPMGFQNGSKWAPKLNFLRVETRMETNHRKKVNTSNKTHTLQNVCHFLITNSKKFNYGNDLLSYAQLILCQNNDIVTTCYFIVRNEAYICGHSNIHINTVRIMTSWIFICHFLFVNRCINQHIISCKCI